MDRTAKGEVARVDPPGSTRTLGAIAPEYVSFPELRGVVPWHAARISGATSVVHGPSNGGAAMDARFEPRAERRLRALVLDEDDAALRAVRRSLEDAGFDVL